MKQVIQKNLDTLRGVHGFQEHYTRYIIWCDALLNNRPFYEAAEVWYKNHLESAGASK